MFVACGIRCLADVSSVSPSSEQTSTLHICAGVWDKTVLTGFAPQSSAAKDRLDMYSLCVLYKCVFYKLSRTGTSPIPKS